MHSVAEPRVAHTPVDRTSARRWLIVSGEYPPRLGGVGDYTRLIAERLAAAGDDVEVATSGVGAEQRDESPTSVAVRRLPGRFGLRALWRLQRMLRKDPERILYVQYVPHAFGMKGMNVPFCLWLWYQRRRSFRIMFHEVAFPLRLHQKPRHRILAHVTRLMARLVASAAAEVHVTIPAWRDHLVEIGAVKGKPISVLPVPSNLPIVRGHGAGTASPQQFSLGPSVIGHFGTYGPSIVDLLQPVLEGILEANDIVSVFLIGQNANRMRAHLIDIDAGRITRIVAFDAGSPEEIARAIGRCTLLVQPYPDGVSGRRSTAMAALASGIPLVTTDGPLTEERWRRGGGLLMSRPGDTPAMVARVTELLENVPEREAKAKRGRALYDEVFADEHTIAHLRR